MITKKILDTMGGDIELQTREKKGTMISIRLPENKPSINSKHERESHD